ncbi:MAG: putative signal transducing protein [Myxococcales bacterium]
MHDEGWTTLLRCHSVYEAEILRGALEAEDVPVRLLDTGVLGVAPQLSPLAGGVRLQVPERELDRANRVLEGLARDAQQGLDGESEPVAPTAEADLLARRAMIAALVGLLVPVVFQLYALVLLARFVSAPRASSRGRRHAAFALLLTLLVLGPIVLVVWSR